MNTIRYEDLPEVFTDDILVKLLKISELQTPEWRDIYSKMTNQQWLQYSDFHAKSQTAAWQEADSKMTQEEKDAVQLYIRKWGASRWNDGALRLDYEYELMEQFRKGERPYETSGTNTNHKVLALRLKHMRLGEIFYTFSECDHPFSSFYKSPFEIKGQRYASVIQYMAFLKADLFINRDIKEQIMATDDSSEIYTLSKSVRNYDKNTWLNMYFGNYFISANTEKFSQNEHLKVALLATAGKTIVLTDASERMWGAGCSVDDSRLQDRDLWPGKNLLGELLTNLRIELSGTY
jgi:ribA/ribD-fused uncharacterized protein